MHPHSHVHMIQGIVLRKSGPNCQVKFSEHQACHNWRFQCKTRERLLVLKRRGVRRHGIGRVNDNGLLLCSKYAEHHLYTTNTYFGMVDKYKTKWMHPLSKYWHMIDFIIICQCDIRDVWVTHAMRNVECWTGPRLVRTMLNLHILLPHTY